MKRIALLALLALLPALSALAADGGRYRSKELPASDDYKKATLGVRKLEAGAVVLKIGVVNATGARIRSIVVER